MSETGLETDALETAIAENPEEVARFVRRLGLVNQLLDASELATSALDDRMVEELSGTATDLGAAADGMATPELARLGEAVGENADEAAEAVETVAALQRAGTLDDLASMADALALVSAALDDEMVTTLTATGARLGEVAETAAEPETAAGVERLLEAVGEAETADPGQVGAIGLVRAMRDPEVKAGLGYVVALAKAIGSGVERDGGHTG
jgi:uncharacterized protein YjgD (DUF1641 family)